MDNVCKPPTRQQIEQALRNLERKGFIEKKRDALGNVVTRPGKDGKPQVVWVATNVTPLRWE
jgi:DNA-binding PadR family transcriptional regulator